MIGSNISGLRAKLGNLKRDLAEAPRRATEPNKYDEKLKEIAAREIETVFSDDFIMLDDEEAALQTLVGRIQVDQSGTSLEAKAGGISFKTLSIPDEASPERRISREALTDWILLHKEKKNVDRRPDGTVDVEAISARIFHDMEHNPDNWFGVGAEGHGALNPRGLAQQAGVIQVTPDKLGRALEATLAAWNAEVPEYAKQTLAAEVRASIKRTMT